MRGDGLQHLRQHLGRAVGAAHHVEQEQAAVEVAVIQGNFALGRQAHEFGQVAVGGEQAAAMPSNERPISLLLHRANVHCQVYYAD